MKSYTRERSTTTKDAYGQLIESAPVSIPISGIITKKRSAQSAIVDGKSQVGVWVNEDVIYLSPETDVMGGDVIVNDSTRFRVKHIEAHDEFFAKNTHKVAYLQFIS